MVEDIAAYLMMMKKKKKEKETSLIKFWADSIFFALLTKKQVRGWILNFQRWKRISFFPFRRASSEQQHFKTLFLSSFHEKKKQQKNQIHFHLIAIRVSSTWKFSFFYNSLYSDFILMLTSVSDNSFFLSKKKKMLWTFTYL